MKTKSFLAIFTFLIFTAGCVENKMLEYEDDPAIYFFRGNESEQRDSIKHSFFLTGNFSGQDTIWVRVNATSKIQPVDRPISIVQKNIGEPGAAIPGVHYVAFDDPNIKDKMVIPANRVYGSFPVVINRHPDLDLDVLRIEMEVAENEYFRPGINLQRNFLVTTTSMATKPQYWDTGWRYFFGTTWGTVKFRFIIEVTGLTEWTINPIGSGRDTNYYQYLGKMVKDKFNEYNLANPDNPLMEANGDLVRFN